MGSKKNVLRVEDTINTRYVTEFDYKPVDMKIIEAIYLLRCGRTKDIQNILGNVSYVYLTKRMRKLYRARFIDRKSYVEESLKLKYKGGSKEMVYFLDQAGKLLLSGMFDVPQKAIKWRSLENLLKYDKVKHELQTTHLIALVSEAIRNIGGTVVEYLGEKHLVSKYTFNNKDGTFRPDAYIKIKLDGKEYSYFIENDNSTMSAPEFAKKVYMYDNYRISKTYELMYGHFPKILVITSTQKKAYNLAIAVNERLRTKSEWLFTYIDKFEKNPLAADAFINTSIKEKMQQYSMINII